MKKIIFILLISLLSNVVFSQARKVQNRPYIDQRKLHYGFLIGMHTQDLEFTNNGFITEEGESWFADIGSYIPGFTVGVLTEYYLHEHIALRVIPSLYFGDKTVTFKDQINGGTYKQSMKSIYVGIPINVKFSAERFNNYRPYVVAGLNPMLDLSKRKQKALLVKGFDCYAEIGLGCDFYMPFFKLIPELKFSFGLMDLFEKNRNDLIDKTLYKYTQSIDGVKSKMVTLTFYFE